MPTIAMGINFSFVSKFSANSPFGEFGSKVLVAGKAVCSFSIHGFCEEDVCHDISGDEDLVEPVGIGD